MDKGTWKMRDGRVIKIVDLGDLHLCNILKMCQRIMIKAAAAEHVKCMFAASNYDADDFDVEVPDFHWGQMTAVGDKLNYDELRQEAIKRQIPHTSYQLLSDMVNKRYELLKTHFFIECYKAKQESNKIRNEETLHDQILTELQGSPCGANE